MQKRTKIILYFFLGVILLSGTYIAYADQLDACIDKKQKAFEAPRHFSQSGSVTCPSGDIVGFPPRIRTHDRNATVTFTAPDGYVIENKNINSVRVVNVSSNSGTYGQLRLGPEDTSVSVDISCSGRPPTEGRAWQEIRLEGTIIRKPTVEQLKAWVIECARSQ